MLVYKGVKFDFHSQSETTDENNYNWSQICASCADKYGFETQEDSPFDGDCGIEGCNNEACCYIDFDGSESICELGGNGVADALLLKKV